MVAAGALLLAAAQPIPAGAQAQPKSPTPAPQVAKPAQIDRNGVLILVRSTLLALDQANKTGNYSVFRDLGAPSFQVNNPARLAEIFAKQRNDNLDFSGVAVIEPQLTLLPQIEANGAMHMAGFFPSVPSQVNFDLSFLPANGQWRLHGISVSIGQMMPTPPITSENPPVAAAPKVAPKVAPVPFVNQSLPPKQPPIEGASLLPKQPAGEALSLQKQ
jgi:hypothetical protein